MNNYYREKFLKYQKKYLELQNLIGGANEFQTVIENFRGNIYTFSDVHGDIPLLIVLLRDCCRVIRKKDGFGFNQNNFDTDLDNTVGGTIRDVRPTGLLHHYLRTDDYIDDLNYMWCGENSHVVIIGDMIDNFKSLSASVVAPGNPVKRFGEYVLEEIKLLKFINAIDKQARAQGGRIIKLMGNHELMNLTGDVGRYSSEYSKLDTYKGQTRLEYFRIGRRVLVPNSEIYANIPLGVGVNLLGEGGIGVVCKINDWIFVHGGISTYNTEKDGVPGDYVPDSGKSFLTSAEDMNKRIYDMIQYDPTYTPKPIDDVFSNIYALLWNRYLGEQKRYLNISEFHYCQHLKDMFKIVCNDHRGRRNQDCEDNTRIVIGHCIQYYNIFLREGISGQPQPRPIKTFTRLISGTEERNNGYEVFKAPNGGPRSTVNGVASFYYKNRTLEERIPFNEHELMGDYTGITVDCQQRQYHSPERRGMNNSNHPAIFRVEVGSSRASIPDMYFTEVLNTTIIDRIKTINCLKHVFMPRSPQVLHIRVDNNGDYEESIIRSTLKNFFTHIPLPINETLLDDIKNDRIPEILPYRVTAP